MAWYRGRFPASMTVGERKTKALRTAEKLGRKLKLNPVVIEGPLAHTWWGKAWNHNLEGYADYSNRLPRGRSYARHGSVIDLRIEAGSISALVQGSQSRPYEVAIYIVAMDAKARALLIETCAGKLDSAEALLSGRFPEDMGRLLTAEKTGLFPRPDGIRFSCSCPDSANLCKHVAAALYGVGARLDRDPTHFFRLRKIELEDLVSRAVKKETQKLLRAKGTGESVRMDKGDEDLSALFGIDIQPAKEYLAPAEPGSQLRTPKSGLKKGKKVLSLRSHKDVKKPPKKKSPTVTNQKTIQDTLRALESLSGDILKLESELSRLLK